MRPPAILLGGSETALSVARSLTRAGVDVIALGPGDDPLRYSRHRRAFIDLGSGAELEARCLDWLERGPGEGVLLPCSDAGILVLARNRPALRRLGYVGAEADDRVLIAMLDKQRTFELARAAGVEAPWVGTVSSVEEAIAAAARVGYPCALKPRDSHRFARRFTRDKALIAGDEGELRTALERTLPHGLRMMVSEIVPGPDSGFCSYYAYVDEGGRRLFEFTKRKPRQYPPKFGTGCHHVMDPSEEAAELGRRFFEGVGVRGLANVEFKRDQRDGRLKLIECNHRFTASNELMRRCGLDLALFAYNRALGLPELPAMEVRRPGMGLWYPLRDLRAFLAYRRRGELTAAEWARSLLRPQCFPLASLSDPLVAPAVGLRKTGRRLAALGRAGRTPGG